MTVPKPDPATGSIPATPTVTSIRATVKHPRGSRHRDVYEVAWLPTEGWWCNCSGWTAGTSCDHVRAVRDQVQW